jgi:hypothetical protein
MQLSCVFKKLGSLLYGVCFIILDVLFLLVGWGDELCCFKRHTQTFALTLP